jgi:hypothetical protein
MATGSYEESLSMEVIPDHHDGVDRHGSAFKVVLASLRILQLVPKAKSKGHDQEISSPPEMDGEREGEPQEVCDRGDRGSIASAPWEENAHVGDSKNKMVARPMSSKLASHVFRSAEAA